MADRFMSLQNLKFTLNSRRSRYPDLAGDILNGCADQTIDMVFKSVQEVGNKIMHPIFEEMDRKPPTLEKGVVKVHPAVRSMLKTLGKDGWIAASFPEAWGGEEMPVSILHCINFIFAAANYSAAVYPGLTKGAANLLFSFGSAELQKTFLPPMPAGKWQGTMVPTDV
jgi:alkylation response protein AidB-like acyl-CoA dehydrogenase